MKNYSWILTLALLTSLARGGDPIRLPEGGQDVIQFRQGAQTRLIGKKSIADGEWVPVKEMPFRQTFRADISRRTSQAWDAQLVIPIDRAFKKNSAMLLSFWVRCTRSEDESGSGTAAIYVQSGQDRPRFGFRFSANREWRQWVRPFLAPADYDSEQSNISVHLSALAQTIEIAGVQLLDFGSGHDIKRLPQSKIDYEGRQTDAPWRRDALARIERIRKGNLTIDVSTPDGKPIEGASVAVRMRRHEFPFGTAVNVMVLAGDHADFPVTRFGKNQPPFRCTWNDAQRYREVVEKYFTRVTFEGALRPHVWKLETGAHDKFNRQFEVLNAKAVPWLKARKVSIRGHYIGWGAMEHPPLQRDFVGDPKGHRQWLWAHMADILPRTSEYVSEWDTINHVVGWGKTYEAEHGGPKIHADIMREARRLAPKAIHAINEGQVLPGGARRKPYQQIISYLKEQGQGADVVGFMGHFESSSLTPPAEILKIYDQFAEIAPRLQLTELDVDTDGDDQLQADYLRDILIASFSHSHIDAIIQWGFWEKQHWKPKAALWRGDWSLRPAGEVFIDLVANRWWTNETAKTNSDGACQVRGFLGQYDVTVKHDGSTVTASAAIKRQGSQLRVVVP